VIRYDENGIEVERVTVGLQTRLGGSIPPEDDLPPEGSTIDSMTISEHEVQDSESPSDTEVAG
jgi:hypothetical protein